MLAGTNLTLWRGTTRLFEELSFVLPAGSALMIEGPNGSGKTTLLRVIAGLTTPEAGVVTWEAISLRDQLQAGAIRLAFFGHALALKPEVSARDNLGFFARLSGRQEQVNDVIALTGLAACADLDVRLLSAGQKRRASLARFLLSGAGLWLLDEPQTNLDKAGRKLLERVLGAHLGSGGTAVIAAHQALDLGSASVCRLQLGED